MKVFIVVRELENGCEIKDVFASYPAARQEIAWYRKQGDTVQYSIIEKDVL